MDFFEAWFGWSPDGGDGSTEMIWLGAIAIAVVAIVFRRRIMAALTSRSSKRP
jgi:LPXTG-motif cell wall-anchored protein